MNVKPCSYWPLATTRQRRIQAIRLLKLHHDQIEAAIQQIKESI